jgi:uncharacterized protein
MLPAVHPESYPLVERILADIKKGHSDVIGDKGLVAALNPAKYTDERFGLPTVQDILAELEKPGRDPRPEFKAAAFREGIEDLKDLEPGMLLEGVVTNVTNFGAFVDIGVHQDGLVHVSALANKFVKDPHSVVKAGDVVKVKVLEVDIEPRKRIALTMRLADEVTAKKHLPTSFVIGISIPTIASTSRSMKSIGASDIFHGCTRFASCVSVRWLTWFNSHSRSSMTRGVPCACTTA